MLATSDFPLRLEAGQKQQRVVLEVPDARLWSPEAPHQYRLVAQLIDSADVEVRLECRSYELGWILWSFGRRTDLPELTHNRAFGEA